jgi:predicted nucleotidyltransferase
MEKSVEQKLPEIKALFQKYGAERAFVFGSAATNSSTTESDVDFLFSFPLGLDYEAYANNYFSLINSLQSLLEKMLIWLRKNFEKPFPDCIHKRN